MFALDERAVPDGSTGDPPNGQAAAQPPALEDYGETFDIRPGEWFSIPGTVIPAYFTMGDDGGVWLVTDVDTAPDFTFLSVRTIAEDAPPPREVPSNPVPPPGGGLMQVPPPPNVKPPNVPPPLMPPMAGPPVAKVERLGPLTINRYPNRDQYTLRLTPSGQPALNLVYIRYADGSFALGIQDTGRAGSPTAWIVPKR